PGPTLPRHPRGLRHPRRHHPGRHREPVRAQPGHPREAPRGAPHRADRSPSKLDLGKVNGEHFAVMAGVGFDAELQPDVDGRLKRRLGRMAYFWTGWGHVRRSASPMKITIDGRTWFDGKASCVLIGNVGRITGGVRALYDAPPDDGWVDGGA